MTRREARKQMSSLAVQAARIDGGRIANRLSAYAMLIEACTEQEQERMRAELERIAERTLHEPLVAVLYEGCQLLRALEPARAGAAPEARVSRPDDRRASTEIVHA